MPEKVRIRFDDTGKPLQPNDPGLTSSQNGLAQGSSGSKNGSSNGVAKRKHDQITQASERLNLDGADDRNALNVSDSLGVQKRRGKHLARDEFAAKSNGQNGHALTGHPVGGKSFTTESTDEPSHNHFGRSLKIPQARSSDHERSNGHSTPWSGKHKQPLSPARKPSGGINHYKQSPLVIGGGQKANSAHASSSDAKTHINPPSDKPRNQANGKSLHFKNHDQTHERSPNGKPSQPRTAANSVRPSRPPTDSLTEKARRLQPFRQALPIWSYQKEIRECLSGKSDVMLLVGETGSGKSTQVPQFLLNEPWCTGRIAVTQPRRVAAYSLAKRVAEEMGSHLGTASPSSKVGYSVRFDNCVSPNTRIKYLTEGMLLQEMLKNPALKEYSAVVIDEVHERSLNVDLVLGFVRKLVTGANKSRNGKLLKVVVMSATINVEKLAWYFDEGFEEQKNKGKDHNGKDLSGGNVDEDSSEESWAGFSSDGENEAPLTKSNSYEEGTKNTTVKHEKSPLANGNKSHAKHNRIVGTAPDTKESAPDTKVESNDGKAQLKNEDRISLLLVEGRNFPVQIKYLSNPTNDLSEDALSLIFKIHTREPLPGDILVFLTGQDTVESMEKEVTEIAKELGPEVPKLLALPLFAALPRPSQAAVFEKPPPKTRRVILSTNIAETSVTIPNIRHVIDSGLFKLKEFRPSLGLDSLLTKEISMSSAIQRKGRAGREAAGHCYRLYTEDAYLAMQREAKPEILRCNLASAVLNMFARGVDDPKAFPFVDAPDPHALDIALVELFQHRAIDVDTKSGVSKTTITPRGRTMARLPLSIPLANTLLIAAEPRFDVAAEVIDIISALTVENVFLQIGDEVQRDEALEARRGIMNRRGDHLTLLATVRAYAAENVDRKEWCRRRGVSHRAMQSVMDVRKQLLALATQEGLLSKTPTVKHAGTATSADNDSDDSDDGTQPVTTEKGDAILKSFLRGFISNTAIRSADKAYRTFYGRQKVAVHPSSVIAGKGVECFVYQELVFTNRCWARGVSAVDFGWLMDAVKEGEEAAQDDGT